MNHVFKILSWPMEPFHRLHLAIQTWEKV